MQDAPSTESYIHPQPEWTQKIYLKEKEGESPGLSTGITSIDVVLEEVLGSLYVFAGFNRKLRPQLQYFFWNSITQSCDRITYPLGKDSRSRKAVRRSRLRRTTRKMQSKTQMERTMVSGRFVLPLCFNLTYRTSGERGFESG